MYQQTDKRAAVREIQKYLYFLSDAEKNEIPRIPVDGIFDFETKNAVMAFQKTKDLPQTGTVDFQTHTLLYEAYEEMTADSNTPDYIFGDGTLPFREGDMNEDVRVMHIMINELSKEYSEIENVGTGAYFSSRTGDEIKKIRKLFIMGESRIFDKKLFKRVKEELYAIKRREKYSDNLF